MVTCGHLGPAAALESVTAAPREALGLPPVRIAPGCPADLVALPGIDALAALGAASAHRTVWRAGTIVARTTVRTEIASPATRNAIRPDPAKSTAMEGAAS
jgi:cytosine deaminase